MAVPTTSWDETSPAGSQAISLGDDAIRLLKTQIREVIDVDHDFPSNGQANDVGQHKKVTFQESGDLPTGAANATILGSQTVSGKGELCYVDEDDNTIQITNAGKINGASVGTTAVPATAGGTGQTTIAQGEILYASAANTISKLGVGTAGMFLKTLGAAANPAWAYAPIFKLGTFTYDLATASGTQNIASIGFIPRLFIFIGSNAAASGTFASWGMDDGTTASSVFRTGASGVSAITTFSLRFSTDDSNKQEGKITTLGDTSVITWTKTGTITGTMTITYLAIQ